MYHLILYYEVSAVNQLHLFLLSILKSKTHQASMFYFKYQNVTLCGHPCIDAFYILNKVSL